MRGDGRSADWAGGHGITEADIDLGLAACIGEFSIYENTGSGVSCVLADLLSNDRSWVEHYAVLHHYAGDVAEALGHRFQITRTEAK